MWAFSIKPREVKRFLELIKRPFSTPIFQIPCASRSKPSSLYSPQYYDKIFNGNQQQIAKLCKELLYIDYYFRNIFQKKFDRDNASVPCANDRISFAHNARTICIAFVAFASRYYQGNIKSQQLETIITAAPSVNATLFLLLYLAKRITMMPSLISCLQ